MWPSLEKPTKLLDLISVNEKELCCLTRAVATYLTVIDKIGTGQYDDMNSAKTLLLEIEGEMRRRGYFVKEQNTQE